MEWYDVLKDFGFPVFVAIYLLVVTTKTLRELRDAVKSLIELIKTKL